MLKLRYLTSIRGLLAFVVVLYHLRYYSERGDSTGSFLALFSSGYVAVDFFFLLSGFVLAFRYEEQFGVVSANGYLEYLVKRLSRIYPLHIFIMALYGIFAMILVFLQRELPNGYEFDTYVVKLLLLDSWLIGSEYWNTWNVPSWTISAEFFAYLLLPFLINLMPKSLTVNIVTIIAICVTIVMVFEFLGYDTIGSSIGTVGVFRCVSQFIVGICVFNIYTHIKQKSELHVFYLLIAVSITIGLLIFLRNNYYYITIMFAIILLLILKTKSEHLRFFDYRPFELLGNISYSVYLSHLFILMIYVGLAFGEEVVFTYIHIMSYLLIVLIFSIFTYFYIEAPLRKKLVSLIK